MYIQWLSPLLIAPPKKGNSSRGYISARLGPGTSSTGAFLGDGDGTGKVSTAASTSYCLKTPSKYSCL